MNVHAWFMYLCASACVAPGCSSSEVPPGAEGPAGTGGGSATLENVDTGGSSGAGNGGAAGTSVPDACLVWSEHLQKVLDGSKPAEARGAILGVMTPQCGKWVGATGWSQDGRPMEASDLFRIGSVTKTFVATRALLLAQEGALDLDSALATWFPEFPNAEAIRVRQLLNHTSGIFNYTDDTDFWATENTNPSKEWLPEELIDVAAHHDAMFSPGTSWSYSNTNYILLGLIVEQVGGMPIAQGLRQNLQGPLGLSHTWFDGPETVTGEWAHGYSSKGQDVTFFLNPSWAWSAGAMVSTASDLLDWSKALYSGSLLNPDTMAEMLATVPTGSDGLSYGLGVFALDPSLAIDTGYGHMGDIPGFHTQMFYFPNEQLSIATVVNGDGASPNPITSAVLLELMPELRKTASP